MPLLRWRALWTVLTFCSVNAVAEPAAFQLSVPFVQTGNRTLDQAFRIAIGDIAGNISLHRSGLLAGSAPVALAGLGYATPWTRDASMNTWNGLGILSPGVARNTLLAVLEQTERGPGVIGGSEYWDSIVWAEGAWRYFLVTGDREFLALALRAVINTLAHFESTEYDDVDGLFRGPGWSDGVAGYPPEYADTGGESGIQFWPRVHPDLAAHPGFGIPMKALSTNCLYYNAYRRVGDMQHALGLPRLPEYQRKAERLRDAINTHLWNTQAGHYLYLTGPFGSSDRQEALGHAYAILFGIADADRAASIFERQHVAPAGVPSVWPNFERYRGPDGNGFARHAGTVWPQIQGMWAQAAADHGRDDIFGYELFQLASHAARDRQFAEIYHPITGEPYGGWQERKGNLVLWNAEPRQTWAATAYVRMVLHGLAGITVLPEGVRISPCVPKGLTKIEILNVQIRGRRLDVTIRGTGTKVEGLQVDGRTLPADSILRWDQLPSGAVSVIVNLAQ